MTLDSSSGQLSFPPAASSAEAVYTLGWLVIDLNQAQATTPTMVINIIPRMPDCTDQTCGPGTCVDDTPFDRQYSCDCSGTGQFLYKASPLTMIAISIYRG